MPDKDKSMDVSVTDEDIEDYSYEKKPQKKIREKQSRDKSRDDMMEFEGKMIYKKDLKKVLKR